jgi:hypothetical protein
MPTTLLNPYSVALKKEPFLTINSGPVYVDGDYRIYKFVDKHYIYTFKNIVATERCGLNKDIISHLKGDTKPKINTTEYYHNKRSLEAIAEGVEYAKMLNFKVI